MRAAEPCSARSHLPSLSHRFPAEPANPLREPLSTADKSGSCATPHATLRNYLSADRAANGGGVLAREGPGERPTTPASLRQGNVYIPLVVAQTCYPEVSEGHLTFFFVAGNLVKLKRFQAQ